MKYFPIFLFCPLFTIFTGCFKDNNPAQIYPIEDYLPLKVGNWWKYVEVTTGDTIIREITKCDTFEGNLYYHVSREDSSYGGFFFCFDGQIGWEPGVQIISDDTGPDILLKEPIESGARWSADVFPFDDDTLIIAEIKSQTSVPSGVFENCVMVRWEDTPDVYFCCSAYGWDFAPDVGIIRWVRISKEDFENESDILIDYHLE
jgi:hypothetical protein